MRFILDLLALAVIVHRRDGSLIFANAAAREAGWESSPAVARLVREAAEQPGLAVLTTDGADQLCSVAAGDEVVTFVARPEEADVELFTELFGLTASESRVASMIATGMSAPAAARAIGCSSHTVHAHLKSVFAKTGTNSQVELTAAIRGGISIVRSNSVRGFAKAGRLVYSRPSIQPEREEPS